MDLYAERLLMLLMTRAWLPDPLPGGGQPFVQTLLASQQNDGSWSLEAPSPYHGYHATMLSTWALATWLSSQPR